jgi:hypothetical protein
LQITPDFNVRNNQKQYEFSLIFSFSQAFTAQPREIDLSAAWRGVDRALAGYRQLREIDRKGDGCANEPKVGAREAGPLEPFVALPLPQWGSLRSGLNTHS